jgi:thiamine biosynthesis lipoprotein
MMFTRRAFLAGAGSLALARPVLAGSSAAVIEGSAFGASWRAVVPEDNDPQTMRAAVQAIVNSVDAAMSPFRADSEIARFNDTNDTDWVALSAPSCEVVAEALRVAGMTAGAFDPTVGGVVGQYGFGPITRRSRGDLSGISLRAGAVKKALPDLTLDLCGVAKGHALDRMVEAIEALGAMNFLLEVGGEVAARGRHPDGRKWQVGIEKPEPGDLGFQRVVALAGEALATSGDRVNSYVTGGRRYSHIIDPHRSRPADTSLASVSVLASTAMRADAMATALFAMGHEAARAFAEQNRLPALFLVREKDGICEITTGSFDERILA